MNQRPKILIVDDEPLNVDYLEQELEDLGYQTVSASNGQEALDQVAAQRPDLVLLDIMMPVMDGFEALSRLKADEKWRHLPVVIVSAMSDMASVIKGIQLGAEDYLPKPFDPILLQARIGSSLEKKRLRDQEQVYMQSMENELEIGRSIQAGFLPDSMPEVPGWEIEAYFEAAREVAGDFYDAFWIESVGRVALVIGDVCDKGVGSALYMALFRSLLRAFSNPELFGHLTMSADPSTRLQNTVLMTNNYIAAIHAQSNMFATLFFGLLDPQTGSLLYVSAGQEPPVILNADGVHTRLRPTGPLVGLLPDRSFAVSEVTLQRGDWLIAYSDGVTDAENIAREQLSEAKLLGLFQKGYQAGAGNLLEFVMSEVHSFIGEAKQFDDITLLAVHSAP
jgi:serine phosphatase RsbU (regulator of sigma subunit)